MSLRRWLLVTTLLLGGCASATPSGDSSVPEPAADQPASANGTNTPAASTVLSVTDVEIPVGSPSWQDFRSAVAAVESALSRLGYEHLGGDHPGPASVAFHVGGLSGEPEVQLSLGWEKDTPMGAYSTIANAGSELDGIRRGEGRIGVWFRCGPLSVEMLADDLSSAAALADRLQSAICEPG